MCRRRWRRAGRLRVMIPMLAALSLACDQKQPSDTATAGDTSGDTAVAGDSGGVGDTAAAQALEGTFVAENSAGRHGSYYLPAGYNLAPLPVLVAFHGTGGDGSQMVSAFRDQAQELGFAIVAPDSRQEPTSGAYTWEVGTEPGEVTEDLTFALVCLDELLALDGVALEPSHLAATGFSGGGSSAPYLATNTGDNDAPFTHFAVLHGGVFAGGIGDNIIPGWFSTGEDDTARSPEHVQEQVDSMVALGFTIEFRLYPGGHELGQQEREEMLAWWLGS